MDTRHDRHAALLDRVEEDLRRLDASELSQRAARHVRRILARILRQNTNSRCAVIALALLDVVRHERVLQVDPRGKEASIAGQQDAAALRVRGGGVEDGLGLVPHQRVLRQSSERVSFHGGRARAAALAVAGRAAAALRALQRRVLCA